MVASKATGSGVHATAEAVGSGQVTFAALEVVGVMEMFASGHIAGTLNFTVPMIVLSLGTVSVCATAVGVVTRKYMGSLWEPHPCTQ